MSTGVIVQVVSAADQSDIGEIVLWSAPHVGEAITLADNVPWRITEITHYRAIDQHVVIALVVPAAWKPETAS